MKGKLFTTSICLLFVACSQDVELEPDQSLTSGTPIVTKVELMNDSILPLDTLSINLLSSDDYPFGKFYPEIGKLPAPSVYEGYTNAPERFFALRIDNPLLNKDGSVSPALARSIGQIQIQWRVKHDTQWYNYNPKKRNCEELYTDTIFNRLINEAFYPQKGQWEHSLDAKALPKGEVQFRARLLLLPTFDGNRPLEDATLWSVPYNPNYYMNVKYGYDFNHPEEGTTGESLTARIGVFLNVNAHDRRTYDDEGTEVIEKVDQITISALGKKDISYLSYHPCLYVSTSKNVVIGTSVDFIYDAAVSVSYTDKNGHFVRAETTNKRFTHSIYVSKDNYETVELTFYDYIDIY